MSSRRLPRGRRRGSARSPAPARAARRARELARRARGPGRPGGAGAARRLLRPARGGRDLASRTTRRSGRWTPSSGSCARCERRSGSSGCTCSAPPGEGCWRSSMRSPAGRAGEPRAQLDSDERAAVGRGDAAPARRAAARSRRRGGRGEGVLAPPHLPRRAGARVARRSRAKFGKQVYETMWGPNEFTVTGTLKDWDVIDRLGEIEVPTLDHLGPLRRVHACARRAAAERDPRARSGCSSRRALTRRSLEETERYLQVVGGFLDRIER